MRKHSLAFSFGVALFTFLILLTENYYDNMLVDLTTTNLLIFTSISTLAGGIAFSIIWVVLFIINLKRGKSIERPRIYNISIIIFLLFALILYLYVRDLPLRTVSLSVILRILTYYIIPIVVIICYVIPIVLVFVRKREKPIEISFLFTFGVSLAVFLSLLSINYYDKLFYELKTIDLLWYSFWATLAGGVGAGVYYLLTERPSDLNLSGAFILIFFGLLYLNTGNVVFEDIIMATFISVLTFFSFILISGFFVLIMLFSYYKKKSRWI